MPGPKPIISVNDVKNLLDQGYKKTDIAKMLDVSIATVKRHSKGLKANKTSNRCVCNSCGITGKEHFYKNAQYQCKTCWNKRTYQTTKDKLAEYMASRGGAKCQKCGYDKCVAALDFHHRDPTQKDPKWNRSWSFPRLKIELDKCDILCANCHREIHWNT